MRALLLSLLLPAAALAAPQRGVSLGLFSEDAGWSYRPLLEEIAATGADHVELVVPWYMHDVRSVEVHDHPRLTPPPQAVLRAVRDARALKLRVLLFPILRLEEQRSPDEWRGTLAPSDRAALMAAYARKLVDLARMAQHEGVEILSVGSELSTLDVDREAWVRLVAEVRKVYRGKLTYSGNWDHFEKVRLYDLVDYAGVCAYFSLGEEGKPASQEDLDRRWAELRARLEKWAATVGRPLLLTEVGYLSQRGAAAWPWNEGASEPVDLEEQARCYRAFAKAWADGKLGGAYFWNWYGWGGATSGGYTPRGKPAAEEMKQLFRRWR